MKRLFATVFLLLICAMCLYAQNNRRNRGVIVVDQYFHGWTHCHLDRTPTFGRCTISTINKDTVLLTSDKSRDTIAVDQMFVSDAGDVFLNEGKTEKLGLHVTQCANHIDDNVCDYDIESLKIGRNRSNQYERKSHCIGTKNEGYDVYTNVIVDNPVEIISTKDNSSLSIDDSAKCELSLNDFYVAATTEFYLSVKLTCEDNTCWRTDKRTFSPKQALTLSYNEICSIARVEDEFDWSGRKISIKITKKLIDGSWSDSNVILCTFIHKGPDFEIQTVRRTACSDDVELIVTSEKLGAYPQEKFKWAIMHIDGISGNSIVGNIRSFDVTSTPNTYKLTFTNNEFLSTYLREKCNELKPWYLQLQERGGENDSSAVSFDTKEFEIAPRAPQIEIAQYTESGTEIESGLNPYVRIKIEDLDTFYDNGRVPYKVYEVDENDEEHYLTTFYNRITSEYNADQLKSAFNGQYPQYSWSISDTSFKHNKFKDWYKENSGGSSIKTIRLNSFKPNTITVGQVTDAVNVLCDSERKLYFYDKGGWCWIDFSSTDSYPLKNSKTKTTINGKDYDLNNIESTTYNNWINSFITESSDFIVFRSSPAVHVLFLDGSTPITDSPSSISTSYHLASTEGGKPCLIYFDGNGSTFYYYEKGKSARTEVILYKQPDNIEEIIIGTSDITYVSGGQCYQQKSEPFSESVLYKYFTDDKYFTDGQAVIPSTYFDKDWEEFEKNRNREYAKYLAERLSYKISDLKHFTEDKTDGDVVTCSGKLKVQESDGCYSDALDYKFQYRKIKFNVEIISYPTTISAKDGVAKLTLVSGGLAPYIVNGIELNKGNWVKLEGCYYGSQVVSIEDAKGDVYDYTFDIPLPKHTIETNPIICSNGGGEIIVTCEDENLKLSKYYLKQNGDTLFIKSPIGNKCSFWGLAIGDYEVWGEFGNGNQVLLAEKQTIVDESFSVSAVVDNAAKIGGSGTITLTATNAIDNNISWSKFIDGVSYQFDNGKNSIRLENVAVGEYRFQTTANRACCVDTTVNVSAPDVSMFVDLTIHDKSARVAIDSIHTHGISEYYFESNGTKIDNYSEIPYDKGNAFNLNLRYKTPKDTDFQTYTIINERFETAEISVADNSDPQRCWGTDGSLKIEAKDIPQGVKCYYQVDGLGEEELTDDSQTIDASIGEHSVYVRQEQSFSDGRVNVNVHTDNWLFPTVVDGTPTDAVVAVHDVKCKGSGDGYIEILTKEGGLPQNVWLCQDKISTEESVQANTRISGLQKGQYTFYVIDGRCPNESEPQTATISEPEKALTFELDDSANPTCRDNDGAVTMRVTGGWGNYKRIEDWDKFQEDEESYLYGRIAIDSLSSKDNLLIVDSLSAGSHTFTIVDDALCEVEASVQLEAYSSPRILGASVTPAKCNGSADGEIAIDSVSVDCAVVGKDLSLIINGDETQTLPNPYQTTVKGYAKGTYDLKIVDANQCYSETYTVAVSEPEPLNVVARLLDNGRITYHGGDDGRMEIEVSGGNMGNNIVTYGGNTTNVPTNVPYRVEGIKAGTVKISATDSNGCLSNNTEVTFTEPAQPLQIETEASAALCHAMTGLVKVRATGGWDSNYTIRLVGEHEKRNVMAQKDVTFEGLYAGDYTVEVTDKYGARAAQTVRVESPEPISHSLDVTPELCDGDGKATVELSGGTKDYVSLFANSTDSIYGERIELSNLVGGQEYKIITWDANHCESRMTFIMPNEQLSIEIKHTYTDEGINLSAEVSGGSAPYTYSWRNLSSGEDLGTSSVQKVTQSGLYRLEVTDAGGCMSSAIKSIMTAGSIAMSVKSVTRTTNINNNDGTATIVCKATQAVCLRLYHLETDTWITDVAMHDGTTINITSLEPGHYCLEGVMEDGTKGFAQFYIEPYVQMEVTKIDVKHVSAQGKKDASVVVDIVGGISPYTVNDTMQVESNHIELANLGVGGFTLSVIDSTGNVLNKDIEIVEPEQLVITAASVMDASCNGYSDGSVKVQAAGGWGDYQFAKGNGEYGNGVYYGSLGAGECMFRVVDKYGVVDSVNVVVGEPEPLRASVAAVDSVSCKGMNDGGVHFSLTGGTATYSTAYEKETVDGTDVKSLPEGTYIMNFTDSHGCAALDTLTVYMPEPDLLEVADDTVTNTTCELDNGKIAIEMKGGSLPYTYKWTENGAAYDGAKAIGMTRSEAEELKQDGLYHIEIVDGHGCKAEYEKRIERSENPHVLDVATTDVRCFGSSDGMAIVDSSQVRYGYPRAAYHLIWPQGQSEVMSVNTLSAGTYVVKITDDNNCSTTTEFTVGTPKPVENHLSALHDALCFGYSDGRIETYTTGGVGEYAYEWNTGATASYADSLTVGTYVVIVSDSHQCKDTATYRIDEPEELEVNLGDDAVICPNNIHVFDGGEYATYSWTKTTTGEEIETERFLATGEEGAYAIKVTNAIGCIARDTVNLSIGENALQANFLMASDAAVGDTVALIELSNMPLDSLSWEYDTDAFTEVDMDTAESYMFNISVESTGRYYITMWAYSGGCESFEQKHIDIYEAIEDSSDFSIGYSPLIKQVKVTPNPNDGEFDLIVSLREEADVDVIITDVDNGQRVEHLVLHGEADYNSRLNIKQWGGGIFALSITSGNERRAIKILCTR